MLNWPDHLALPDGVTRLTEPVGWECTTCGSRMVLPDTEPLRRHPDTVAELLLSSAEQHLHHGCVK